MLKWLLRFWGNLIHSKIDLGELFFLTSDNYYNRSEGVLVFDQLPHDYCGNTWHDPVIE